MIDTNNISEPSFTPFDSREHKFQSFLFAENGISSFHQFSMFSPGTYTCGKKKKKKKTRLKWFEYLGFPLLLETS